MAQFDVAYRKTSRVTRPCPPCPAEKHCSCDGGPGGVFLGCLTLFLALIGLITLVRWLV